MKTENMLLLRWILVMLLPITAIEQTWDQWLSSASSNESGVEDGAEDSREEESVPEHIETSVQEAVDVSPGAFTAGASYHTAQSQTTNNNPSIVSDNQPTIRTRRSERASKGRHSFRQRIDM